MDRCSIGCRSPPRTSPRSIASGRRERRRSSRPAAGVAFWEEPMTVTIAAVEATRSRVRMLIVLMLFLVTTVNYAARATLSIAGSALSKELHLDPVALGYIFSAFGWSYVAAQVPGGWLLDRYGSKSVYACSILVWSVFTMLQGWIGLLAAGSAVVVLFALRFLVGLAEAPSFPANA